MKHIIFLILFYCFTGCGDTPTIKTALDGKPLPAFNLQLIDSASQFNTNEIPAGQPVVFMLFTPDCPYCRALTQEIIADRKLLNSVQLYLLSSFPYSQIKNYYDEYHLKKYPKITVGQDLYSDFAKYFNPTGVPYIAIYGKDKHLKQVFIGKVSAKEIEKIALD